MDNTAASLGENVTVAELVQGRSPALDLDSLYGRGPHHPEDAKFYSDAVQLKMGMTAKTPFPPDGSANIDLNFANAGIVSALLFPKARRRLKRKLG